MQAEYQHAIFRFCFIERRFQGNAAIAGFEGVLERPLVIEQGFRLHVMHGVGDVPEPQIRFGQGPMQRLGARHRDQPLLVGAAEENGNPHQPCFLAASSFRDGPKDQARNLEILRCAIAHRSSMLSHRPGMTFSQLTQAATTPPLRRRPIYCNSANTPVVIAWATTMISPFRFGLTAPENNSAMLASVHAALPTTTSNTSDRGTDWRVLSQPTSAV